MFFTPNSELISFDNVLEPSKNLVIEREIRQVRF
jgi:hypothetical protein